jgi:uncharacterized membrane-anchored protein YhcB (DUF1043 family)
VFEDPVLLSIVLAASVFIALIAGAVLGRRTGQAQKRITALEAQVEARGRDREMAEAAAEAAKLEVARVRGELRDYREGVVEHFTGTSGLLRELTQQYRAVYEHLTEGATTLCPKGSVDQLESLRMERLPEAGGPSTPAAKPRPAEAQAPSTPLAAEKSTKPPAPAATPPPPPA